MVSVADECVETTFARVRDEIEAKLDLIGRVLSSRDDALEADANMLSRCIALPLGADGLPIRPREVVYGGDGLGWRVSGIGFGEHCVKAWRLDGRGQRVNRGLRPGWLTHERPDSWEAIAADAGGEIAERIRRLREAEDGHAD